MKLQRIGLIGGVGCFATIKYYDTITREINGALGDNYTSLLTIDSLNTNDIIVALNSNKHADVTNILSEAMDRLLLVDSNIVALCCNTLHNYLDIHQYRNIFVHILEPTCAMLKTPKRKRIGLIATSFTSNQKTYQDYLQNHANCEIIRPDKSDQKVIDKIIFNELCKGIKLTSSQDFLNSVLENILKKSDAIILGCTELSMLIKSDYSKIFDTSELHAKEIAKRSIYHNTMQSK